MADTADGENKKNNNPSASKLAKGTKRSWKETQDDAIMPVARYKKCKATTKTIDGVTVYSQEDLRNVGVTVKAGLDFVDVKTDSDTSHSKVEDDENVENVLVFSQSPVTQKCMFVDVPHCKAVHIADPNTWCTNQLPSNVNWSSGLKNVQKGCKAPENDSKILVPDSVATLTNYNHLLSKQISVEVNSDGSRFSIPSHYDSTTSSSHEANKSARTRNSNSLVDYETNSESEQSSPESGNILRSQSNTSVPKDSVPEISHSTPVASDSWITVTSKWTNLDEPKLESLTVAQIIPPVNPPASYLPLPPFSPNTSTAAQPWNWLSPTSHMTTPPSAYIPPVPPYLMGPRSPEASMANWTWPHRALAGAVYPNRPCSSPQTPLASHHLSFLDFGRRPRELFSSFTSSSETSSSSPRSGRNYSHRFYLPSYDVDVLNSLDPSLTFIDTHCHLDFLFNRCNFKGTYSRYRNINSDTFHANYEGCVAIFCDPQTFGQFTMWKNLLEEDNVWGAFGCHPHMAHSYDGNAERFLKAALTNNKVVALGEIGLDYSAKNTTDHELQKQVFRSQLRIAKEWNLPLVIHSRNSHLDTIQILREEIPKDHKIHRHCFTGDWKEAQLWLSEFPNLYLGLTALVTFSTAREVHEVARLIPLNKLLLETDAPYFLPRQVKKELRWSHPGMAIHVAAQVAALRFDANIEDVLKATRANTKAMYGI